MEALKPRIVLERQEALGLSSAERMTRRNRAYIRQGEWFFVRQPHLEVETRTILRNEPLSRGNGSQPHMVEELVRTGGKTVFVSSIAPAGFTAKQRMTGLPSIPTSACTGGKRAWTPRYTSVGGCVIRITKPSN